MRDAMQIQATIQNNAQVTSQLSDAYFKLDVIGRSEAINVVNAANAWSKSVAGVRQEFGQSMQALTNYMGTVSLPAVSAASNSYNSMSDHLGDNKTNWGSIALGVVGGAVGFMAGGPLGAAVGAGIGSGAGAGMG